MPNVTLYITTSRKNDITKNLTSPIVRPCEYIANVDTNAPRIVLDYFAACAAYNYAYIDGVYYFISPPEMITGGRVGYRMRKDVLQTYAAAIKSAPCIISRSYDYYNSEIFDAEQLQEVNGIEYTQHLASFEYNADEIILCTIGG